MIDEIDLTRMIKKCKHLKYKFLGVYAANNFLLALDPNTFIIVNSDKADQPGSHWILLCNRDNNTCLATHLDYL